MIAQGSVGSVAVRMGTLLQLADTCLLWGHRLSEWCGHGPQLEEDIALTNTALDVLGQARFLYSLHAARLGDGTTEDDLAYFRDADEFQNVALAEVANGDYAQTISRSLFLSAWIVPVWSQLASSEDLPLAAFAREAIKASRAQLRHATDWTIRFGDGTSESRQRIERALETLAHYLPELVATTLDHVDRDALVRDWLTTVNSVFREATLKEISNDELSNVVLLDRTPRQRLLAEMQSLAREHPGASW